MMKKWTAVLVALCLVLGLSGAFAEEKDLLDTVLERGTLIVGTEGTYAPNSYYDEDGVLVGFDVEVAAAIAEKLGVKVEYYVNTWSALFMGMDNGQCDTVINEVEVTEERKLKYDFSAPYTYIHGALLVAEDNDDIQGFDDVQGKRAAQNATSTWGMLAESLGATIVPVNGDAETFELIKTGRADLTLNAETAFNNYMTAHPEEKVKIVARTDSASSSVVPVPKGSGRFLEAVNKAIEELRADGTLSALSLKYFGFDYTQE